MQPNNSSDIILNQTLPLHQYPGVSIFRRNATIQPPIVTYNIVRMHDNTTVYTARDENGVAAITITTPTFGTSFLTRFVNATGSAVKIENGYAALNTSTMQKG
jgi:hypothetical protein